MTSPFTPQQTFTDDSTPVVTAEFLNRFQADLSAVAGGMYARLIPCTARSLDGATILVRTAPAMIKDSATGKYVFVDGVVETVTPTGLSNNTWYYLYLVSTNGVASLEYSTTQPEGYAPLGSGDPVEPLWKSGDETRRYVLSFRTFLSAVIGPFQRSDGANLWFANAEVVNEPGSSSYSVSPVSLDTVAPPHARRLTFRGLLSDADGTITTNSLYVRPAGFPLDPEPVCNLLGSSSITNIATERFDLLRQPNTGIEWKTFAANGTVLLYCTAWKET